MNDTSVAVIDVPMLHPMIIGMAWVTVSEVPVGDDAPTRPTTIEVDVEDDCTRTVTRMPAMMPIEQEKY